MKKLTNLISILTFAIAFLAVPFSSKANQFVFPEITSKNGGSLNAKLIIKGIKITQVWNTGFNFDLYIDVVNQFNIAAEGNRNNTFYNFVVTIPNGNSKINTKAFIKNFSGVKYVDATLSATTYGPYSVEGITASSLGMEVGTLYSQPAYLALLGFSTATLFVESAQLNGTVNALYSQISAELPPSSLAVTLSSFTAQQTSAGNVLAWQTSFEKDSKAFIIERSHNATQWTVIGELASKAEIGENDVENNYEFVDQSPLAGNNFYRLKMVDLANEFEYSKVLRVNNNTTGQIAINVYPNPTIDQINVDGLTSAQSLVLLNSFGQVLATSNTSSIDLSNMAKGMYWVQIIDSDSKMISSHKVIKK